MAAIAPRPLPSSERGVRPCRASVESGLDVGGVVGDSASGLQFDGGGGVAEDFGNNRGQATDAWGRASRSGAKVSLEVADEDVSSGGAGELAVAGDPFAEADDVGVGAVVV